MNPIEGELDIHLYPSEGRAEIRSSRPAQAASILEGRSMEEVLDLLPGLFSVCATAQACAGTRACEQALGVPPAPSSESLRDALVGMETIREHLWRVLLEWPEFLEEQPDRRAMAEASALHQTFRRTLAPGTELFQVRTGGKPSNTMAAPAVITKLERLLEASVFAMPPEVWITLEDDGDLAEWASERETAAARLFHLVIESGWADLGRSDVPALPALRPAELQPRMNDPEFIRAPTWEYLPRETGPLARQERRPLIRNLRESHGNGLITRLSARLLELALLPSQIRRQNPPQAEPATPLPGFGLAQVEAARGRLAHWVHIADGTVKGYRILAPTEWNFHPEGPAARALAGLPANDPPTLRRQAALLINAVDPCVGYRLTIH